MDACWGWVESKSGDSALISNNKNNSTIKIKKPPTLQRFALVSFSGRVEK